MNKYLIELSDDEALVLFEFLSRSISNNDYSIKHPSEVTVLSNVLCTLEENIHESFCENYKDLLGLAQNRLST